MYNRVVSGGVRVPPDYSGSAIKYHPAEEQGTMQTFCPPASKPTPPPQKPCGEGGEGPVPDENFPAAGAHGLQRGLYMP